jgi:hypothetical protein
MLRTYFCLWLTVRGTEIYAPAMNLAAEEVTWEADFSHISTHLAIISNVLEPIDAKRKRFYKQIFRITKFKGSIADTHRHRPKPGIPVVATNCIS